MHGDHIVWQIVKMLLKGGAEVNATDMMGRSALHYCMPCGYSACVSASRLAMNARNSVATPILWTNGANALAYLHLLWWLFGHSNTSLCDGQVVALYNHDASDEIADKDGHTPASLTRLDSNNY